jgi:polyisoprenyl-teichoic acid--peptidoglycan teichoic acid transferase
MANQSKKTKSFGKKTIAIVIAIFIIIAGVSTTAGYQFFKRLGSNGGDVLQIILSDDPLKSPETEPNEDEILVAPTIMPEIGIEVPKWDGKERVTLLLLGLDYRDWTTDSGPPRSDTMILLTIDPLNKTAGMMSIPRDLWVNIPNFDPGKINTAYFLGEAYRIPGGGPALAMKTVEETIGVPIDYYAQIDFGAFEKFIDLIGGVKIDVQEHMELEIIGKIYDVPLSPGVYVLPGDHALAYARQRYLEGGDFSRAERQQQVIMAIRDRLLNPETFGFLIENAGEIYEELSAGINTNLPITDAINLALLAIQIDIDNINRAVIGPQDAPYGMSPDDLSILLPNSDRIRALRDSIFSTGGTLSPLLTGTDIEKIIAENAVVHIYNGTGNEAIFQQTEDYLNQLGFQNIERGSSSGTYANTQIYDHKGTPYAMSQLTNIFNINSSFIYHRFDIRNAAHIELYIGTNWLYNNSLP